VFENYEIMRYEMHIPTAYVSTHLVCGKQDNKDPFEYVSPEQSAHTVSVEPVPKKTMDI